MTIATCQNCKSDFTIDKYRLKKRILLGRVFCKECSYKIAAKEADYEDRRRKASKTNKDRFGFEKERSNCDGHKDQKIKIKGLQFLWIFLY